MKKLNYFIIFTLFATLVSCAQNLDFATGGTILSVNEDNHFTEDIVYITGDDTFTFNSDGTFEYTDKNYETSYDENGNGIINEGWVVSSGDRGTYSWDPKTYLLTVNYSLKFNSSTNEWRPLTNSSDYIKKIGHALFTTRNFTSTSLRPASMFFKDRKSVETIQTLFAKDTDNLSKYYTTTSRVRLSGETYVDTVSFIFNDSSIDYTYHYIKTSNENILSQNESLYIYSINSLFPENTAFSSGKTYTFIIEYDEYFTRSYDTNTSSWEAWTTNTYNNRKMYTFAHLGDYLVADPTYAFTRETE